MAEDEMLVFFVAAVEGIICAFDEDNRPLDEAGGEKPRYHAEDNLLEESGMHPMV
jgi:hypothetical protein